MNYRELATNLIRKEGKRVMEQPHHATWQEIRSLWVNGEAGEAKDLFLGDDTSEGWDTLRIILECLDIDIRTRTGSRTGDIIDLREIIRSLV